MIFVYLLITSKKYVRQEICIHGINGASTHLYAPSCRFLEKTED
jgi:hypothetical protein